MELLMLINRKMQFIQNLDCTCLVNPISLINNCLQLILI
jgi:hypothetical protein